MSAGGQKKRDVSPGPPLSILVREKLRSYVRDFPWGTTGKESKEAAEIDEARTDAAYSPSGSAFAQIEGADGAIVIRDARNGSKLNTFGGQNSEVCKLKVNMVTWSPKGSFLLSWARPTGDFKGENLIVWNPKTGEQIASWHQKTFHIDYWPTIQWSDDEKLAARMVKNNIHFYDGLRIESKGVPLSKLRIEDVGKFTLSKGKSPYKIAAFIPGKKGGGPGRIAIYQHPEQGGQLLSQKSTFRADSAQFLWNSTGTALLAKTSTHIDATGKSYYGESDVYYFKADGSSDQRMSFPKDGPVHDVQWSPSGVDFVVVYGYMPARATMFNEKCEPIFDFGTGPRNTVSFSPHGRFVALAGFGNLPGHVDFWDKNKTLKVGECDLPCTTSFCWSPCSRYFLGATNYPRLRVDNQFTVVRFDGERIMQHRVEEGNLLYQSTFRPAFRGTYEDPKLLVAGGQILGGDLKVTISGAEAGKGAPVEIKKGAYRPPGAKGRAAAFSLHDRMSAGKVDKSSFMSNGTRSYGTGGGLSGRKKYIPGADVEENGQGKSKSAKKNAKKRKKKKKKDAQEGDVDTNPPSEQMDGPAPVDGDMSADMLRKKIKGAEKKLRQIETLKKEMLQGKELDADQKEKVGREKKWQDELSQFQKKLQDMAL